MIILVEIYSFLRGLVKKKKVVAIPTVKQHVNTLRVICPICDFEHPETPQMDTQGNCGNCAQPFYIQVHRTVTGRRVRDVGQSLDHDEILKTFTTRPVCTAPIPKTFDEIKTVEEAVEQYNIGHIKTPEELRDIILKKQWDVPVWNVVNEENPLAKDGVGFKWNCHYNKQGKFFQWVVKPIILRAIDFMYGVSRALHGKDKAGRLKRWMVWQVIHIIPGMLDYANKLMQTNYDKDAFVFTDPDTVKLKAIFDRNIKAHFVHDFPRKAIFMLKCIEMGLALDREDVFYRTRRKLILNDIIKEFPDGFKLTPVEEMNLVAADGEAMKLIREKGQTEAYEKFIQTGEIHY